MKSFLYLLTANWTSQVVQWLRIWLPVQEMRVRSLGWEDSLEKELETYSGILLWEVLQTEESDGLGVHGIAKELNMIE